MHKDFNPELWLTKVSVMLVLCGVFLFAYGAVASTPAFYGALLSPHTDLQGNLLASGTPAEIRAPHPAAPVITPRIPQPIFLVACLLIVSGACLDVRRRLRHLGHH